MNPREIAVTILVRVDRSGNRVDDITHAEFKSWDGYSREKRFIQDLVYGVTRWKNKLDFMLQSQYHGRYAKAEYVVKNLLRIGLYQTELMDSVPAEIAINETVELSKSLAGKRVSGLINGVLRSIIRNRETIEEEMLALEPAEQISVYESHPFWLVNRWVDRYGLEETKALCRWNNRRPDVTVRINTTKTSIEKFVQILQDEKIQYVQSPILPEFFDVQQSQDLFSNQKIPTHWFAVQDIAAGITASLVEPSEGDIVVDACAAPGGKATYIAQNAPDDVIIYAFDVNAKRLDKVESLAAQLQLNNLRTGRADATSSTFPEADWILLDVPCTGTGVLAKRADARWRRSPENITRMSQLQTQILHNSARAVKKGGTLVYSTCTLEPEENWGVVEKFLEQNKHFTIITLGEKVSDDMKDSDGALMILPHRHKMDGAFAAILRRIE